MTPTRIGFGRRMKKWFKLSTVADALGLNVHTLRGWISKGYVFDEETKAANKAGGTSYLDEEGVIRLAIMQRLVALGVDARRAFEATLMFLDIGDPMISFNRENPAALKGFGRRDPGELYKTGETLVVCPAGAARCEVLNIKGKHSLADVVFGRFDAALVLHLNPIVVDLKARLAAMPFEEDE